MRYTTNKNMLLPGYTDIIDIEQINDNFEIIDEHFKDPDAHAELFLALETKIKDAMNAAITAATDSLIHMIMVSGGVFAQLTTSDDMAVCTANGEEIIAVKKL